MSAAMRNSKLMRDVKVGDGVLRVEIVDGRTQSSVSEVAAVTDQSIFLNDDNPERFQRDTGKRYGNPSLRIEILTHNPKDNHGLSK